MVKSCHLAARKVNICSVKITHHFDASDYFNGKAEIKQQRGRERERKMKLKETKMRHKTSACYISQLSVDGISLQNMRISIATKTKSHISRFETVSLCDTNNKRRTRRWRRIRTSLHVCYAHNRVSIFYFWFSSAHVNAFALCLECNSILLESKKNTHTHFVYLHSPESMLHLSFCANELCVLRLRLRHSILLICLNMFHIQYINQCVRSILFWLVKSITFLFFYIFIFVGVFIWKLCS